MQPAVSKHHIIHTIGDGDMDLIIWETDTTTLKWTQSDVSTGYSYY